MRKHLRNNQVVQSRHVLTEGLIDHGYW